MFIYLEFVFLLFIFVLIRLVTGLYEESHGLISDQFYDPKTNSTFELSETMSNRWWPIRPIWTINQQRIGGIGRSGVIGWRQDSIGISRYQKYQKDRPYQDIIDQMLSWFNHPTEPINFGAIFFSEPGLTGKENISQKILNTINSFFS